VRPSSSSHVDATRRSLVLGSWALVCSWSFVLGPATVVHGLGTTDQLRTTDQGRTKNQAPGTRDQLEPWLGTWHQIPPATKWFAPWPYQQVILRIEPLNDGLRVVYDMVRRRGGITHMEWSGRFDGRDSPVQGVDYVLTNAYRKLSERSYEITVKVDGRVAAIATTVVAPDGRTLKVETRNQDAQGRPVTTTATYQRR